MEKTALIIVDIQQDYFPGGLFPLPQMTAAAETAAQAIAHFRKTHRALRNF